MKGIATDGDRLRLQILGYTSKSLDEVCFHCLYVGMYNIMNIMTIMTYVIAHMMFVERPGGMREMIDPDGSRD